MGEHPEDQCHDREAIKKSSSSYVHMADMCISLVVNRKLLRVFTADLVSQISSNYQSVIDQYTYIYIY